LLSYVKNLIKIKIRIYFYLSKDKFYVLNHIEFVITICNFEL